MSFEIFPMVRYMGHAFLSLLNTDSAVLSDNKITGATTAPSSNFSCVSMLACSPTLQSMVSTYLGLPPPVTSPHFIIDSVLSLGIGIHTLWHVRHHISQDRIPKEFLHIILTFLVSGPHPHPLCPPRCLSSHMSKPGRYVKNQYT